MPSRLRQRGIIARGLCLIYSVSARLKLLGELDLRRSSLVLILVVVLGAGTWFYIYGLLDPAWKAQKPGADPIAYHSDLYERWLGTRLVLKNHANPYDKSVTEAIQKGAYGHPLGAIPLDPRGFAYPAHVILLVAPLALLPFSVAAPIFSVILCLMALCLMPLFMSCLGQTWSGASKRMASLVLFASLPLVVALYVQQLTIFVVFATAAGLVCLKKNHPVSAGILFALTTIKPQLVAVILGWLAVWSITRWRARYPVLVSFLASMTALVVAPEFLVSDWIKKWLAAADLYLQHADRKLPATWLLPGTLASVVTVAAMIPAVLLLWRLRDANPREERFGFAVAVALAVTLLVVPVWPAVQYNQLLLIPAVLVIVRQWPERAHKTQWRLSMLALAILGFGSVSALGVSLVVLVFRIPVERLAWPALPFFNFAVVPFLMIAALVALLWNQVMRGQSIAYSADASTGRRRSKQGGAVIEQQRYGGKKLRVRKTLLN